MSKPHQEDFGEAFLEELKTLHEGYWDDVYRVLDKVSKKIIKPYCKERGLVFISGNGTWCFFRGRERYMPQSAQAAPKFAKIADFLDTPIPGEQMSIGSCCPCVGPEDQT